MSEFGLKGWRSLYGQCLAALGWSAGFSTCTTFFDGQQKVVSLVVRDVKQDDRCLQWGGSSFYHHQNQKGKLGSLVFFVLGSLKSLVNISYKKCSFGWLCCYIPSPKLFTHVRPSRVMMDWDAEPHQGWILSMRCFAFSGIVQLWSHRSLCAIDQGVRKGCIVLRSNGKQLQQSWMQEIIAMVFQNWNGGNPCIF